MDGRITIQIYDYTNNKNAQSSSYNNTAEQISLSNQNDESKNMLAKSIFVNKAFEVAKQAITTGVELKINRQVTLTEDYVTGYQWQNIKTTIGMVSQIGGSIVAGFMMGGVPGALIAGAGAGLNVATNVYNQRSAIAQQINTANYNMAFQQTRMTLVNNSRGTEN